MIPTLRDDRVVLAPWTDEDLPALAAASRDPEITRWTRVPEGNTTEGVRAFRAERAPWIVSGSYAVWAVREPAGPALGVVDLRVEPDAGRASIGYWLGRAGRGRGFMTRAVRLVAGWALAERGLARVEIHVDPRNPPSLAVAERAGFVREGLLRSYAELKGRRHDVVVLSRLPGDGEPPAG